MFAKEDDIGAKIGNESIVIGQGKKEKKKKKKKSYSRNFKNAAIVKNYPRLDYGAA